MMARETAAVSKVEHACDPVSLNRKRDHLVAQPGTKTKPQYSLTVTTAGHFSSADSKGPLQHARQGPGYRQDRGS